MSDMERIHTMERLTLEAREEAKALRAENTRLKGERDRALAFIAELRPGTSVPPSVELTAEEQAAFRKAGLKSSEYAGIRSEAEARRIFEARTKGTAS